MSTAATAWSCGTPAAVSPAISPTSITPAPPGMGAAPADHRGQRQHHDQGGEAGLLADGMQRRAQAERNEHLAPDAAPQDVKDLPRLDRDDTDVAPDREDVWPRLRHGHSPESRHQRRHGQATTATASTTMRKSHTMSTSPLVSVGLWKSPAAKGRQIRKRAPLTTQLAVPAMAPELMADSTSSPGAGRSALGPRTRRRRHRRMR